MGHGEVVKTGFVVQIRWWNRPTRPTVEGTLISQYVVPSLYGSVLQPWGCNPTYSRLEFKCGRLKCLVI